MECCLGKFRISRKDSCVTKKVSL